MSNRKYPRWDSSKKLPAGTTKRCDIYNCEEQAVLSVCMQFSWFRGEDECANFCQVHRDRGMKDPEGMCASTREGAWK